MNDRSRLLLALSLTALLVTACSAAPSSAPGSADRATRITFRPRAAPRVLSTPESPAIAGDTRAGEIVYFATALGTKRVLVAVGSDAGEGRGVRLLSADATGRRADAIGPHVPRDSVPDSAFFLNRRIGWFATENPPSDGETLYRTRDAGRRWRAFAVPGHNLAGGSTDVLDFVDRDDGWLAAIDANGPVETLYRTSDGGAHWRQVAAYASPRPPAMPRLGAVEFERGGRTGWLGGDIDDGGPLARSSDGGRTWRRDRPAVTEHDVVGSPTIFGDTLIEPVVHYDRIATGAHFQLRTYVSTDNGGRWRLASAADVGGRRHEISTTFPTPTAGWCAALDGRRIVVHRTTDQGRHWSGVATPRLMTGDAPTIIAIGPDDAWLLAAGLGTHGERVYATHDAGRTWQRIDQRLT